MPSEFFDDIPTRFLSVWNVLETTQQSIRYKGRCIPEIPRYCIERFSMEGDLVLDAFMGSGTCVSQCIELNRRVIGVDISRRAIRTTQERLKRFYPNHQEDPLILRATTQNLPVQDESIDLIFAHIPYWSVITYTTPEDQNKWDLSRVWKLSKFHKEMDKAYAELYRVLKWDKYTCVLVGDVRQGGRKIPLGFITLNRLLNAGFSFFDIIVKVTDNAISMRRPIVIEKAISNNRTITMHEYIIIVQKSHKINDLGV
ncbi:MAG: TRM11 family SAM-dependent methyltransferase [Candidatus Hermodarchaeota archaeon]